MGVFFTSDTHFGHANVIKYCNRPFADLAEMDAGLIERWNKKVTKSDIVYHTGDFAFVKDAAGMEKYVRALNGQIHLVMGNHDQKRLNLLKGFADVKPYKEIKVGEQKIILFHYAMKHWNGSHRGSWDIHGHAHGSLPRDFTMKQLDVGVDVDWCKYAPVAFEEVVEQMQKHRFVPVDHHEERD